MANITVNSVTVIFYYFVVISRWGGELRAQKKAPEALACGALVF